MIRTALQRIQDTHRLKVWRAAATALLMAQKSDDGTVTAAAEIGRAERFLEQVEARLREAGQAIPSWAEAQQ